VRGRAVALFAFASLLACAPAWASSPVASAPRHAPLLRLTPSGSRNLLQGALAHTGRRAIHATPGRPRARLAVTPGALTYLGGRATIKWSAAHATRCTLSSSPRFWAGKNPARVKCNGRITPNVAAADSPLKWTFTLKARNAKGQVAKVRRILV